jgi:hypothetical protein
MIKKLLVFILGTTTLAASAQLNGSSTGLVLDYTNASSDCNINDGLPGTDGVMQDGNSFDNSNSNSAANLADPSLVGKYLFSDGLKLISNSSPTGNASWFPIAVVQGSGASALCKNLFLEGLYIDMSSNTEVTITAKADAIGATLEFYIGEGSATAQWSAVSSTYNTGTASIIASHTFTTANADETFTFDLAAIGTTDWDAWSGKSLIQSVGYRSKTASATFNVKRIEFGSESSGSTGGGETCSDGIMNQDETGVDCGGSTCSPCNGGGTGNGTNCIVTTDNGGAEATYYTNLEDVNHNLYTGNVTCSYTRADIVGTNYGALETRTLHGTGTYPNFSDPTKYCGMCVEMTGLAGTAIVQVVDECPDCDAHNSDDTDIDLSPSAFAAIVGAQSIGRSHMSWEEVSCPWTTPLHVIFQGSNYSYAKVIIGNHVNRIEKVEIGSGGTYYAMVRGVDNGWELSGFGGAWNNFIMDVRVTDIYGEEVVVTGLSLENNPTDTQTDGTSNFPVCGLTTSNGFVNALNYVSVFPNPATSSVTFEGIEDVKTMEIINLSGRVVATKQFAQAYSNISLDISNLAAGIYVAKMTGENATGTATFIKK